MAAAKAKAKKSVAKMPSKPFGPLSTTISSAKSVMVSGTYLSNLRGYQMRFLRKPFTSLLLLHLLPFAIFCIMGGAVAVQAGQDQNWDLQNYHYYVPYAFFHHRQGFDFAVSGIETYDNPLLD